MNIIQSLLEGVTTPEEAEVRPAWTPRVIRGGKGPPEDNNPTKDWLSPLEAGCVFSCRQKGKAENYSLMILQIIFKHAKTIVLADSLNSNPYVAVDPMEFCKRHEFFELINNGEAECPQSTDPSTSPSGEQC